MPVLGSRIGGVPETLDPDVTGVLLPPGDVAAWREAILAMCEPTTRLSMGGAARQFVQVRFSTAVIAAQFIRILTDN